MIIYLLALIFAVLFVAPIFIPGLNTLELLGALFNLLGMALHFLIGLIQNVIAQAF